MWSVYFQEVLNMHEVMAQLNYIRANFRSASEMIKQLETPTLVTTDLTY